MTVFLDLPKLGAVTLHDQIYSELKDAILRGVFPPGSIMTIRALADAFGVSTMPVREALRRLVSEHALEQIDGRRIRVPTTSVQNMEELTVLRALVEGYATRLAAANISEDDINNLEKIQREYELAVTKNDVKNVMELNKKFHFLIYEASKSPVFIRTIKPLWLQGSPYFVFSYNSIKREKPHELSPDHNNIINAFKARDGDAAEAAMKSDILSAGRLHCDYLKAIEQGESPSEDKSDLHKMLGR